MLKMMFSFMAVFLCINIVRNMIDMIIFKT